MHHFSPYLSPPKLEYGMMQHSIPLMVAYLFN
nr:MAG TPA: hypothetical protein [Caudoviricetes sp.]